MLNWFASTLAVIIGTILAAFLINPVIIGILLLIALGFIILTPIYYLILGTIIIIAIVAFILIFIAFTDGGFEN